MEFEYDPSKSDANREKHGIDFVRAQFLWTDQRRIVAPARSTTEPREAIIATLDGVHWTAVYTMRGQAVRIISVRRSSDEERLGYNNR